MGCGASTPKRDEAFLVKAHAANIRLKRYGYDLKTDADDAVKEDDAVGLALLTLFCGQNTRRRHPYARKPILTPGVPSCPALLLTTTLE